MQFGLALDFGSARMPLGPLLDEYARHLALAEQYGFDAVFAGQTFPTTDGHVHQPSPLLILAALAPRTSLKLGTGVTLMPAWQPLNLAYDSAVLDQLSGGRLVLGMAVANPRDWRRFGLAKETVGPRLDKLIQALKVLWTGAEGYHGQLIDVPQAVRPLPAQEGGPPILVGGKSPRAARRAGTLADGWYAATSYRLQDILAQVQATREACVAAGRHAALAFAANRTAFLADTPEQALDEGREYVRKVLAPYARGGGLEAPDPATGELVRVAADDPHMVERVLDDVCLVGSPESVAEDVRRYAAAGVTHIQLRCAIGDAPPELVARTIRLAGERLLPLFRD